MRRNATRELRLEELDLLRVATPDVTLLSPDQRARYDRLRAALELYWQGTKPKEIARLYGVSRQMPGVHCAVVPCEHLSARWGTEVSGSPTGASGRMSSLRSSDPCGVRNKVIRASASLLALRRAVLR